MKRSRYIHILFGSLFVVFLVTLSFVPSLGRAAPAENVQVLLPMIYGPPAEPSTTLVSHHTDGTQGIGHSTRSHISANGRFIAFTSLANNLVDNDTNGYDDVFIHDRQTGETTLISRHTNGTQGNADAFVFSISLDGRFITFNSLASNLVDDDTNGFNDVFVHDRNTGETTLISRHTNGTQGNNNSARGSISADGRFVTFLSWATNLIDDDSNDRSDIFLHDRQTGEATLISRHMNGTQGDDNSWDPSISADGQFVAFGSFASNLVDDDKNHSSDAFVLDRQTGRVTLISRRTDGVQGNKGSGFGRDVSPISANGRYVSFGSRATNLVADDDNNQIDIFVHDRQTGETTLISRHTNGNLGNGDSRIPSISVDGRFVVFKSDSNNLIDHDTNHIEHIFIHDLHTDETALISKHTDGTFADSGSDRPSISAYSRIVAFDSSATNLVDGDTNGYFDVFIRNRGG